VYGGTNGSKVCRFEISASTGAMLDLKSLCISGTVFNLAAAPASSAVAGTGNIQFLSPSLSGLLTSARITVAGVEASSCDFIARTEHVLSLMQSDDVRRSDFNSWFGLAKATASDMHGRFTTEPILPATSRNTAWRHRSLGILQCESYMPISLLAGSLCIEFTFLDDPKSCCNTTSPLAHNFSVSGLVCHVDVLSLDPSFLTNLSQHLFAGNALQMQYQNIQTSFYSILPASSQISHAPRPVGSIRSC